MKLINVFIVDKELQLIENLMKVLINFTEINCIGYALSGKEGSAKVKNLSPEVILMDIRMETPTAGIAAATNILLQQKTNAPEIIFFTTHQQEEIALQKAIPFATYLDKNTPIEALVEVIRHSYQKYESRQLLQNEVTNREITRFLLKNKLSHQQSQIYYYLVQGFSIEAIAEHLRLLETIVRTYQRNIFARFAEFGVNDIESLIYLEQKFNLCAEF